MDVNTAKTYEDKLREACCFGDEESVRILVEQGVDVNAQHSINGWTALHWAVKREHPEIVAYLLKNGAEKTRLSHKGESPASLTQHAEILHLLEAPVPTVPTILNVSNPPLPTTPSYLKNPPLAYKVEMENSRAFLLKHPAMNGIVQSAVSLPFQSDEPELVLKVRVAQGSDLDFIEVEVPKNDLTYSRLLRVTCEELGVDVKHVVKIRKLPDTIVRKDKDVRRLQDFQALELVLSNSSRTTNNGTINTIIGNPNFSSIPGSNYTILY